MVHAAEGAVPHESQHLRGHTLRGGSGPRACHGRPRLNGAGHELRGGRRSHPDQTQGRAQFQAVGVPRKVSPATQTQTTQ